MTSLTNQKDNVKCFSKEIIKFICDKIGKDVLVNESNNVLHKHTHKGQSQEHGSTCTPYFLQK